MLLTLFCLSFVQEFCNPWTKMLCHIAFFPPSLLLCSLFRLFVLIFWVSCHCVFSGADQMMSGSEISQWWHISFSLFFVFNKTEWNDKTAVVYQSVSTCQQQQQHTLSNEPGQGVNLRYSTTWKTFGNCNLAKSLPQVPLALVWQC